MTSQRVIWCAALAAASWGCGRTTVDGIVRASDGARAAGCHVASVLVWDEAGRVTSPPAAVVARAGDDGSFALPRLVRGTHLLIAVRPLEGVMDKTDVDRVAREVAAGSRPDDCLVGVAPLHVDGKGIINSHSGIEISLGGSPGQGLHIAGRLEGHVRSDAFLYDVSFHAWRAIDGTNTTISLHAVPDQAGRFDLGWIEETAPSWLAVRVGPEDWCEVHSDVVDTVVGASDARVVELPFHGRVHLRVEGAPSYAFPKTPQLAFFSDQRFAGMCQVHDARGVAKIMREGTLDVRATAEGMTSETRTIALAPDHVPDEVVLTLVADAAR